MQQSSSGRILEELRAWVEQAPAGARLPSNRALTAKHSASPVTVQKAIRALDALGLIESRPGAGTFVRPPRASGQADYGWQTASLGAPLSQRAAMSATQRTPAPDAIGLHSGYPAQDLLPERLVRAALTRASRSDRAMTRSPVTGLPELQAWFAARLAAGTPSGVTPPSGRDVLILSGSQSGLSSVFRALVGAGRPMLIESPSYWGAILAAAQTGVQLVPISTGPTGPDPAAVERAFEETGARAFYAQPTFANPTGAQWPAQRGRQVLDIVRRHGAYLIEDDWAHDLGIDSSPHPIAAHDHDGHVVYLRSLTKSVSPALRVAALIARGPARDRIVADRAAETMYVSGLLQAAALDVVTQPGWQSHLRRLRQQLRDRRDLLLSALAAHAPELHVVQVPVGGLNVWTRLPDGLDAAAVADRAELAGVIVAPGAEWFPAEPAGAHLRLNFSGPDPERFVAAAQILHRVVQDS